MVTAALRPLFEAEGIALIPPAAGARYLVDEIQATAAGAPVEVVVLGGRRCRSARAAARRSRCRRRRLRRPTAARPPLSPVFERPVDVGRDAGPAVARDRRPAGAADGPDPRMAGAGGAAAEPGAGLLRDRRPPAAQGGDRSATTSPRRSACWPARRSREGSAYRVAGRAAGDAGRRPRGHRTPGAWSCSATGCPGPRAGRSTCAEPAALSARRAERSTATSSSTVPTCGGSSGSRGATSGGSPPVAATAPPPSAWIERPLRQAWLTDPLALDCAFQVMILWSVERSGAGSLPTSVGRYRQFRRAFPADGVRVVARITQADELTRPGRHRVPRRRRCARRPDRRLRMRDRRLAEPGVPPQPAARSRDEIDPRRRIDPQSRITRIDRREQTREFRSNSFE